MPYYNLNAPYSIEDWNGLVRAVNEILENPPEDTDCEPINSLDEVTDPHIWSVEDVTTMRDRLIETCPDISFSEELVLWRPEIIDEIEDQMDEAWCDCEDDIDTPAVDEDVIVCNLSHGITKAGTSQETSNSIIEDSPCAICIGELCHQVQYSGSWYPSPSPNNDPKYNTICETHDDALAATINFITWMNKLPGYGENIDTYQERVDDTTAQMDALIAQYENECEGQSPKPPQCTALAAEICSLGETARIYQDIVDENVELFQEWYAMALPEMEIANNLAVQNQAAALGLTGRFPTDHNVLSECLAGNVPEDWAWWDWWDPESGNRLGDVFDYNFNRASSSPADGVLASVNTYRTNTNFGDNIYDRNYLRLSPDGTWYVTGFGSKALNRDYTFTYVELRHRYRCEPALTCNPEPGTCTYPEWPDFEDWWWEQGWPSEGSCVGSCTGFGCWIWQPLPPPDLETVGTDDWHLTYEHRAGIKDNSEDRDEWLELHNNWYDEHEQYDDRHESYC